VDGGKVLQCGRGAGKNVIQKVTTEGYFWEDALCKEMMKRAWINAGNVYTDVECMEILRADLSGGKAPE
jgi:hypothetical protein